MSHITIKSLSGKESSYYRVLVLRVTGKDANVTAVEQMTMDTLQMVANELILEASKSPEKGRQLAWVKLVIEDRKATERNASVMEWGARYAAA